MKSVNITDFRQHLPTYLAEVQRGVRLRLTSRGKVIAEVSPPHAEGDEAEAARALLRGSVLRFDNPLEPAVDSSEWDANR